MYHIGIDLGGTNIAAGIVAPDGAILHKRSIPTHRERPASAILTDMAALCRQLVTEAELDMEHDIQSVGVGAPGMVDSRRGVILCASNLNFQDTPVKEELQKLIPKPVRVENDANCAALAESVCGAAQGTRDSITVTLGTGVGGGILVDGRLVSGAWFGGGEVGHHVIVSGGEPCACGRRGCWEAYASATALIRDTRRAAVPGSRLYEAVGGDLAGIDAKTAFDAAEDGDPAARDVISRYLGYLAEGLMNLVNIFQPEVIAIGGGVSAQGEKILLPLRERVNGMGYGGRTTTRLEIARLGNDAGIIGAALLRR